MKAVLRLLALCVLALAVAPPAAAHDREGRIGVRTNALVTAAADQLDVSPATLRAAIVSAANARIDAAVASGKIDAARAARMKAKVGDHLAFAIIVSRTERVAANLDITVAQLDSAFREARRALLRAKIDAALAAGKISAERAAALKAKLATARLPGYKWSGLRHRR